MRLGRGLEIFISAKRGELASENTITYYNHWIKDFLRYVVEQGVLDWESISGEHIQSYLAMLSESRKARSSTVHDAYRAIKACNRYLYRHKDRL